MNHPKHDVEPPPIPALPSGTVGWAIRRRCRRAGGHFWHRFGTHSACCQCGAEFLGFPKDGEGTKWMT